MSINWTEIEGITTLNGHPVLPSNPEHVALVFEALLKDTRSVADICAFIALDKPSRRVIRRLIDWLPRSGVAWWSDEERLQFLPQVDTVDLCVRFTAWASAQPIHADEIPALMRYTSEVLSFAAERPTTLWTRATTRPPPPPAQNGAPIHSGRRRQIARLLHSLDGSFLERETPIRCALLGLIAGQHSLLIGPPGTAKSLLARALCQCFERSAYFEYLLSRFTHPDELFGPISIPGLKNEDYHRLTEGFLPTAHVAFLDEIFKANSAILNSLLTLINERVFHHGRHRDRVPLIGLIGASNELPEPGLEALYDRFLFRLEVLPLIESANFLSVCTGSVAPFVPQQALSEQDRIDLLNEAQEVQLSAVISRTIERLWLRGRQLEWGVSDRRWRQAIFTLKVAAAAEDRAELIPIDLLLLPPMLAPTPAETHAVHSELIALLQGGTLPVHDLRAQWILLSLNRVAPLYDQGLDHSGTPDWRTQLIRRRLHAQRFLAHTDRAIKALATHREAQESQLAERLWVHRAPLGFLRAHIIQSRELANILSVASAYAASLHDEHTLVQSLLALIPAGPEGFGRTPVCHLVVDGSPVTLNREGQRVSAHHSTLTPITVAAAPFLDWLEGSVHTHSLCSLMPPYSRGPALIALNTLRDHLGGQLIPAPPALPQPHLGPTSS